MIFSQQLCFLLVVVGVSGRWIHQDSAVRRAAGLPTTAGAVNSTTPIVDLGYAKYQGYHNSTFNSSIIYKGIRFAATPKRWQLPQPPEKQNGSVIQATRDPPRCPQSPPAMSNAATYNFDVQARGDEDCLFLNIFTKANKKNMPVMVWIHGGGYGLGSAANFDFQYMSQAVGDKFLVVAIQYRVGAFGFASSADIAQFGVPNAGLHDQHFALEWVQKYIHLFGGDPSQVTIAGQSAGGGSVMLQAMANGGADGTKLWKRAITASPYLPTQWDYNDTLPTQSYNDFARRAGCLTDTMTANSSVFACLSAAASETLQRASAYAGLAAKFGQWAFIPVTDGHFVPARPISHLQHGRINGERLLTGTNANEAPSFVRQNITTESAFRAFVTYNYPRLSEGNLTSLLRLYALPANVSAASPRFDSSGLAPPFATAVSGFAAGWQQAANNLYAETTFVCPAYWLAGAYAGDVNANGKGKRAWRYQFSVPDAFHGADLAPLQGEVHAVGTRMGVGFRRAFQTIWGNFVVGGDPTLGEAATVEGAGPGDEIAAAGVASWGPWSKESPMLNLNVTQSAPFRARFSMVDGDKWEGGRGERCALWAQLGSIAQM